jgi:four helix bundle protein
MRPPALAPAERECDMLRIYTVMLRVVREMRPVLVRIEGNDRDLARQMRRALASMVLNTGEGSGSSGGTRRERYRNALGSARETQAGLDVAVALGYVEPSESDLALVTNTLYKLSR